MVPFEQKLAVCSHLTKEKESKDGSHFFYSCICTLIIRRKSEVSKMRDKVRREERKKAEYWINYLI